MVHGHYSIIPSCRGPLSPHTDELLKFLLMHLGFFRLFATGVEGVKPGADQENDSRKGGNADEPGHKRGHKSGPLYQAYKGHNNHQRDDHRHTDPEPETDLGKTQAHGRHGRQH